MNYIVCFNSPLHGGGVETIVSKVISGLDDSSRRNTKILCYDRKNLDISDFMGVECINLASNNDGKYLLNVIDRLLLRSRITFSYRIMRFLNVYGSQGDIVNIHGTEYLFYGFLLKVKCKLVVTVHGSYYDLFYRSIVRMPNKFLFAKIFAFIRRGYFYLLEYIALLHVSELIFIVPHIKALYYSLYGSIIKDLPNCVVLNPIDINAQDKLDMQHLTSQRSQTVDFLIVGSSYYGKGLDIALDSIQCLVDMGYNVTLTIVGFSDEDSVYHLNDRAEKTYINYIGRVTPEEVIGYYKQCDMLLFPSRYEGFPMVVLEAIKYGLPCIVSHGVNVDSVPNHSAFIYSISSYHSADYVNMISYIIDNNYLQGLRKSITQTDFSVLSTQNFNLSYKRVFYVISN